MIRAGKYRFEGHIVNTETGRVVPEDIPLFLFLGTDKWAPATIANYFRRCQNQKHTEEGLEVATQMQEWQKMHPEQVHEPDGRL